MPIYAYRCTQCGEEEEHIQKVGDPPMKRCAACGGRLEKLMTSAAFQLKGGGWYADGYASAKTDGGAGGGDAGDSGKSEKSDKSKKSDKPEGKSGGSTSTSKASGD